MDEEQNKSLMSIYQSLPSEIQCAVLCIIEHYEIVDFLVQGEKVPEKEIEGFIRKAMEKKDYLMAAVLVYKKVYEINIR